VDALPDPQVVSAAGGFETPATSPELPADLERANRWLRTQRP
jgi:hypothetical protein